MSTTPTVGLDQRLLLARFLQDNADKINDMTAAQAAAFASRETGLRFAKSCLLSTIRAARLPIIFKRSRLRRDDAVRRRFHWAAGAAQKGLVSHDEMIAVLYRGLVGLCRELGPDALPFCLNAVVPPGEGAIELGRVASGKYERGRLPATKHGVST